MTNRNATEEPIRFAYWVPNVSGGLVISAIPQRTSWDGDYNRKLARIAEDAGFDYATVEGIVRVRIGEGALAADELGLDADNDKSAEFRRPLRVVIAGGEDVYVVDDIGSMAATSVGVGTSHAPYRRRKASSSACSSGVRVSGSTSDIGPA